MYGVRLLIAVAILYVLVTIFWMHYRIDGLMSSSQTSEWAPINATENVNNFDVRSAVPHGPVQRDICIRCHGESESTQQTIEQCQLLPQRQQEKLLEHTQVLADGVAQPRCPIDSGADSESNAALWPYMQGMYDSNETIFEQLKHFSDQSWDEISGGLGRPRGWDEIPSEMHGMYTMGGLSQQVLHYQNQKQNFGGLVLNWTEAEMERRAGDILRGDFSDKMIRSYSIRMSLNLWHVLVRYRRQLLGRRVLVVGSQRPWIETSLLAIGAAHVTTSEYASISATHPQMSWVHPRDLQALLQQPGESAFDAVFSFSSLEHAGLGRYGDPLNPAGDFMEMAQLSCLVKPGGLMFLGAPTSLDALNFNGGRVYGKHRLRLMFLQWRVIEAVPDKWLRFDAKEPNSWFHPLFVLQNKRGCSQYYSYPTPN